MAAKWKSLALHLGLADDVWEIEFRGSSRWRRKGWRDKEKLEMLLKFWKRRKPETYNIQTLKNILLIEVDKEGKNINNFKSIEVRKMCLKYLT